MASIRISPALHKELWKRHGELPEPKPTFQNYVAWLIGIGLDHNAKPSEKAQ